MMNYAICEISGKQYKVIPEKAIEIDYQGDLKEIMANVLMLVEGSNVQVGKPYLKEKLKLTAIETVVEDKIRVAKFHAKANYRRVTGFRPKKTKVILNVKN